MRRHLNTPDFDPAVFIDAARSPITRQWIFGRLNPAANFMDEDRVVVAEAPAMRTAKRLLATRDDERPRHIEWIVPAANSSRQPWRVAV